MVCSSKKGMWGLGLLAIFVFTLLAPTQALAANCEAPNFCQVDDCGADARPVAGTCNDGISICCGTVANQNGGDGMVVVKNPLSFNTVEEVLNKLLGTLQAIIVILSLIFIVIGGILYITSAGDEGRMGTAKGAITASMIGLALGIAAPSFLKEIGTVLGWGAVNGEAVAGSKTFLQIATNVLNFLLSVVGVIGVIMLVIGGLMYLTAAGDEDRIGTGKKVVTYAIIGIAVALAALVIVTQLAKFFA